MLLLQSQANLISLLQAAMMLSRDALSALKKWWHFPWRKIITFQSWGIRFRLMQNALQMRLYETSYLFSQKSTKSCLNVEPKVKRNASERQHWRRRFLCLSQAKYLPLSALVTIPKKSRRHNIDIGAAMIFNLFSSFSSSSSASCNKREFELDYLVCIKNWKECVHREPIDHLESTTTNWSNGFSQHVSNS